MALLRGRRQSAPALGEAHSLLVGSLQMLEPSAFDIFWTTPPSAATRELLPHVEALSRLTGSTAPFRRDRAAAHLTELRRLLDVPLDLDEETFDLVQAAWYRLIRQVAEAFKRDADIAGRDPPPRRMNPKTNVAELAEPWRTRSEVRHRVDLLLWPQNWRRRLFVSVDEEAFALRVTKIGAC